MTRQNLTEVGASTEILERNSDGSMLIQVITPGWGSSGYYPSKVLEAAGKEKAWPKGTHMYFDHPSASEADDRPERSVKDLAATLAEDARWDSSRSALVARAVPVGLGKTVFADEAFRQAVACSVRASAEMEIGEAEGRSGWIVEKIHPGTFNSVDFVTHAGRGGMILESARAAQAKEAGQLNSDRREKLSIAVRAAHSADDSDDVWVRDFDDTTVYWERYGDDPGTFSQTYTEDDDKVTLTGQPVQVRATTTYVSVEEARAATAKPATPNVPVHPAGQSDPTKENSMSDNIEEGAKVSISETKLRQLETDAGRVPLLEAELVTEKDARLKAEQDLAVEQAREYARGFGTTRVREANSELAAAVVDKIVADAMRTIPLTEAEKAADRRLDTETFGKQVDEARKTEELYLASVIENSAGTVRGLGETGTDKKPVTEADTAPVIAAAFGRTVKGA